MPPSHHPVMQLLKGLCCPCILCFQSARIMLCGCFLVCLRSCALWWTWCCCRCCQSICGPQGGCEGRYYDESFPPSKDSLGPFYDHVNEWARLEDLIGDERAVLVKGNIGPSDVTQGTLGDCWLLAAMSAVAEWPALIRKVFVIKQRNAYGKYTFRLYDERKKKFVNVSVDTYIPISKGRPRFSAPTGPEMWVPLLEKAVAKLMGGYSMLEGGSTAKGIELLTGSRIVRFALQPQGWIRSNRTRTYSSEQLFQVLHNFDLQQSIMTCSINEGPSTRGISNGHAFTLLAVVNVGGVELVRLRNPWGSIDWTGAWSDGSEEWLLHPRIAKMFGRSHAAREGMPHSVSFNEPISESMPATPPVTEDPVQINLSMVRISTSCTKSTSSINPAMLEGGRIEVCGSPRMTDQEHIPLTPVSAPPTISSYSPNYPRLPATPSPSPLRGQRPLPPGSDGTFFMCSKDFFDIFDYVTVGVRTSGGFGDIAYNPHEEWHCCGPCCGLVRGCFKFWCCCYGCKALFCAQKGNTRTDEKFKLDGCMA